MLYRFSGHTLDSARRELRRGEAPVAVEPQVFDLLVFLIESRDRVVSKDDLIASVWGGRIVSDSTLTSRINAARKALGDSGEAQRLIRTIARKGLRFVGEVQEQRADAPPAPEMASRKSGPGLAQIGVQADGPASTIAATPRARDVATARTQSPARLSIVVLPFDNMGGDPAQEYFVDGVTESLTTDLSRIRGSFVIARNTAFTYKGKAAAVTAIGRELNVRYVLEGSVQRASDRMRVNVQLVDADSGAHLWAERFDKLQADLFDMQDEIVARLANAINAELENAEARRAEHAPSPDSMDLYFQGLACVSKGFSPDNIARARVFYERALALDPGNVDALVRFAETDAVASTAYFADDRATRVVAAEKALTSALAMAPEHARAYAQLGIVHIFTNRAIQGIAECERALTLDRNLALAHGFIGFAKYFIGRGEETEAHVRQAILLSPRDTSAHIWLAAPGYAKLSLSADEEAVAWLRRSIDANRSFPLNHFCLAAALAHLGRFDEARSAVQAGLALNPSFTIARFRASAASDNPTFLSGRERIYDGMRKGGVPEG